MLKLFFFLILFLLSVFIVEASVPTGIDCNNISNTDNSFLKKCYQTYCEYETGGEGYAYYTHTDQGEIPQQFFYRFSSNEEYYVHDNTLPLIFLGVEFNPNTGFEFFSDYYDFRYHKDETKIYNDLINVFHNTKGDSCQKLEALNDAFSQTCISQWYCLNWEPEVCGFEDSLTRECTDINKCKMDKIEEKKCFSKEVDCANFNPNIHPLDENNIVTQCYYDICNYEENNVDSTNSFQIKSEDSIIANINYYFVDMNPVSCAYRNVDYCFSLFYKFEDNLFVDDRQGAITAGPKNSKEVLGDIFFNTQGDMCESLGNVEEYIIELDKKKVSNNFDFPSETERFKRKEFMDSCLDLELAVGMKDYSFKNYKLRIGFINTLEYEPQTGIIGTGLNEKTDMAFVYNIYTKQIVYWPIYRFPMVVPFGVKIINDPCSGYLNLLKLASKLKEDFFVLETIDLKNIDVNKLTPAQVTTAKIARDYLPTINKYKQIENAQNIPDSMIIGLISAESGGDATAVSSTGAAGLTMFTKRTAKGNDKGNDPFDDIFENKIVGCCGPGKCNHKIICEEYNSKSECVRSTSYLSCDNCNVNPVCNENNDNRFDPDKSIQATVRHLGNLYKQAEDYAQKGNILEEDIEKFTLAFYNQGAYGIKRKLNQVNMKKPKTWEEYSQKYEGDEEVKYVKNNFEFRSIYEATIS